MGTHMPERDIHGECGDAGKMDELNGCMFGGVVEVNTKSESAQLAETPGLWRAANRTT